jgi:hypothetical protein
MVNYKNETTVATPSVDVNKIQILERRSYVIDALEQYLNLRFRGAQGVDTIFRSRLASLFWEIQETLMRQYGEITDKDKPSKEYTELKKVITNYGSEKAKIDLVIEAWEKINDFLGSIRLTRFDTKPTYDLTDTELENDEHQL